uniref:Globin domain-containing protein n=1 Tax=Electrophorus electricus TaxID=8005 RepID=A0AAY5F433_ELEEL
MSLSAKDKETVKAIWVNNFDRHIYSLMSFLLLHVTICTVQATLTPSSRFAECLWPTHRPGSAPVRKHGKKIMTALGDAVAKIDDLFGGLPALSELHAFQLPISSSPKWDGTAYNAIVLLIYYF